VRCSYDEPLSYYQFHRDKDCDAWFVDELKEFAHRAKGILSANVLMETLSSEQWDTFHNATQDHVCEKSFASDDTCVRDHCHLSVFLGKDKLKIVHFECSKLSTEEFDFFDTKRCISVRIHQLRGQAAGHMHVSAC